MKRLPTKFFIVIGILGISIMACNNEDDTSKISREPFFKFTPRFFGDEQILGNQNDSLKIDIETNSYWSLEKESDLDWISIRSGKGTGSSEVMVEVQKNSTVGPRSAWLYLSAFEFKDSLKISRNGKDLAVSKEKFENVSAEGAELKLTVESVKDWISDKKESAAWLTLDPAQGEAGLNELTLTIKKNETDSTRTDSIAFMTADKNASSKVWIKIAQDGMAKVAPSLSLKTSEVNVQAAADNVEVELTSNIDWQATTTTEGVEIDPSEGTGQDDARKIKVSYPENTTAEMRTIDIAFAGKEPNDTITQNFQIKQLGITPSEIIVKETIIDIDGQNQIFTVELTSSNVDWKAVSKDSRFVITENASGPATSTPVQIKINATENMGFDPLSGTLEIQKAEDPEIKTEVVINQGLHPKNDEKLLYNDPSQTAAQIGLDRGIAHPSIESCDFWNAQKFSNGAVGFWNFNTKGGIEHAVFNDDMKVVENGTLKIKTRKLATPTTNMHGDPAEYETAPLYSKRHDQGGVKWVKFTTNMRVEVRYRNSGHQGFNDALWFMGQSNYDAQKIPWPDCGEINLMESPFMDESHFSLHSKNFSAKTGNAETASISLPDETKWNIYWMEIHDDKVIGGINGYQYFEHVKGDGGNNDWPWDNPSGMMMVLTPGIGGWSGEMPNLAAGEEAFMELDWIRIYTNDKFDESSQNGHDGKFY